MRHQTAGAVVGGAHRTAGSWTKLSARQLQHVVGQRATLGRMEALVIRLAEATELESATEVWVRSRWDAEPSLEERMGYTPAQNREYFVNVIALENSVWLALRGDRIVGLLAHREGYVDQLFVEPSEQRTGVGLALLEKAKRLSPERLELYTHQSNARARAFYESQGFEATAFGTSPPPESEPDVTYVWQAYA